MSDAAKEAADVWVPEQQLTEEEQKQPKPSHPIALVFHIFFKVGAILCYLFGELLLSIIKGKQNIVPIIICVLCLAFDFWTTKNVTGRLLVGLRWWNDVKPDGSNEWVFESQEDKTLINAFESKMFWIFLMLIPAVWVIFFITCLMSFITRLQWLAVCTLALVLCCSNVVGYIKCAKDARKRIKGYATKMAINAAVNEATNRMDV